MQCSAETTCSSQPAKQDVVGARRETLLLLHGSAGSSALWREMREALSILYNVIAPDLVGYGAAEAWPEHIPFTLEDEARRADSLVPCCERRIHLVGYSYGGAVALQITLANPVRIKSLTLIEPVFFSVLRYGGETPAFETFQMVRKKFSAALERGDREGAMRDFIGFWTGAESWKRMPDHVRTAMLSMAAKIRLDWEASFAFDPGIHVLQTIGPRTLLMRGDLSPEPMLRLVDALHQLMPGSAKSIVRGANHLLPVTHGSELVTTLLSHLHAVAERELR